MWSHSEVAWVRISAKMGEGHSHPCHPWLSTLLPMLFMLSTDNSKFNRLFMFFMTDSRFSRLPRLPATRFDQFYCSIHVLELLVLKIAWNQNKILAFLFSILLCSTEFLYMKNISPVKFSTGSPTSLSRDLYKSYNLFNTYPDLRPQDTQSLAVGPGIWASFCFFFFLFFFKKKANPADLGYWIGTCTGLLNHFSCAFSS